MDRGSREQLGVEIDVMSKIKEFLKEDEHFVKVEQIEKEIDYTYQDGSKTLIIMEGSV